jgi:hypothetical protein
LVPEDSHSEGISDSGADESVTVEGEGAGKKRVERTVSIVLVWRVRVVRARMTLKLARSGWDGGAMLTGHRGYLGLLYACSKNR